MNRLEYIQNLKGSTVPKLYKNSKAKKWVVKKGANPEQMKYEAAANNIYEAVRINVPRHYVDKTHNALILEYIEGDLLANSPKYEEAANILRRGFIIDALLANWDVIGAEMDNIIVKSDGTPIRIDNGGSFMFRAQGGAKDFGPIVSELQTMRDVDIAPISAKIFGSITDAEIQQQIQDLIIPYYDEILVYTPPDVYDIMVARLNYLINYEPVNAKPGIMNSVYTTNVYNGPLMDTTIINDIVHIEEPYFNRSINYSKYNIPTVNNNRLDLLERSIIRDYTLNVYSIINHFLYKKEIENIDVRHIDSFKMLIPQIRNSSKYAAALPFYYYFVNLYNIIYRAPKTDILFAVMRGVSTWYLHEDSSRFYYFNSFTSTTPSSEVAKKFTNVTEDFEYHTEFRRYIFLVHPLAQYMNITNLSAYPDEKEILFSPYNRYYYYDDRFDDEFTKKFVILPTDLRIPTKSDEFMEWKNTVTNLSTIKRGGRRNTIRANKKMNRTVNHALNRMKNRLAKTIKNKVAPKMNKTQQLLPLKPHSSRFTDPITSFPGKEPTPAEMDIIKQMVTAFSKRESR